VSIDLVPLDAETEPEAVLMIRAMVAEMDEEKDSTIDYTEIKAEPLQEVRF
jgi:hypothetical protein